MAVKSASGGDTLRFECVEIDFARRQVQVNGVPAALGARAYDVLAALIEHRDRVVGKDELLARAWPGLVVEENNLTVQVSTLRKMLGTAAIATVPGRGYQFTLPARPAQQAADPSVASLAGTAPNNLPAERSSFIGREHESLSLRRLIDAHRLIPSSEGRRRRPSMTRLRASSFPSGARGADRGPASASWRRSLRAHQT